MKLLIHNRKNVLCSDHIGVLDGYCLIVLSLISVGILTKIMGIPLLVSVSCIFFFMLIFIHIKKKSLENNLQKIEDDSVMSSIRVSIRYESEDAENTYFAIRFKHCGITEPLDMQVDSDVADFLSFNKKMAAAERELTLTYCRTIPLLYYLTPVETL